MEHEVMPHDLAPTPAYRDSPTEPFERLSNDDVELVMRLREGDEIAFGPAPRLRRTRDPA
jgi:hypothetical protein